MSAFLLKNMDYIFFVYGLSFILLATTLLRLNRFSGQQLQWRWLGLFGLTHGGNEWLDMFAIALGSGPIFSLIRLVVMIISFIFLLEFGRSSLLTKEGRPLFGRWIYLPLFCLTALGSLYGLEGINSAARYSLALPGGILAAWAINRCHRPTAKSGCILRAAALVMMFYAIAAGFIVPKVGFFPATILNHSSFLDSMGFPIQLLRAMLAMTLSFALWLYTNTVLNPKSAEENRSGFVSNLLPIFSLIGILIGSMLFLHLGDELGSTYDKIRFKIELDSSSYALTHTIGHGQAIVSALAESTQKIIKGTSPRADELSPINTQLDQMSAVFPGSIAYLLNLDGVTFASSNRDKPDSFVGRSYAIRPYFQAAKRGEKGVYFAVGMTSGQPGCYLSHPLFAANGMVKGLVVLKIPIHQLDPLRYSREPTFLVSPEGVILVSSLPDFTYRQLWPIDKAVRDAIIAVKQFPVSALEPIFKQKLESGSTAEFKGKTVVFSEFMTPYRGWSIVQLNANRTLPWFRLGIILICLIIFLLIITIFIAHYKDEERRLALTLSEQQYRSMFEKNSAVMILVDSTTGAIADMNAAGCKFYGYTREEIATLTIFDIHPQRDKTITDAFASVAATGGSQMESQHRMKSGEIVEIELYSSPLEHKGKIMILSIVHDISERKRIEREQKQLQSQLIHSDKLASIGILAAGVAHEIANPLAAVSSFVYILKTKLQAHIENVDMDKILANINASIHQITTIVNSLRSYARPDTDRIEAVNIHSFLGEVLPFAHQIIKDYDIQIRYEITPHLPLVRGNIGKLQQVFLNLITNASDALQLRPSDRLIVIETLTNKASVTIRVSDNGSGISESHQRKIFDPFFTTKEVGKGTGLGLAISSTIIKSFGGSMTVSSKEGEGSSFDITLKFMSPDSL